MAVRTFTVTVVSTGGGNKYFIDGVQQATVALARGATYRFDQSDSSNETHPLVFSSDSGNSTPYTTGVTTYGTPGNSGAYTQIAVATSAPANLYYYCSNHAGMGGAANVTSDSFGALSWSVGNWNNQGDTDPAVTGIGATSTLGSITSTSTVELGWGRDTWGARAWGAPDQIVNPSGFAMTAFEGTIDPAPDAMVTGIGATATLGNETAFTDVDVTETGLAMTASLGNESVNGDSDAPVTGIAITAALGDETTAGEINVGWGRLTWGDNAWGEAGDVVLTGLAATATLGNETVSVDAPHQVTGIPITSTLNVLSGVEISFEIQLTSTFLATASVGTADAGPDAMLTGIGATGSVGNIEAYNLEGWGRYFWGQFEYGATGEWEFVDVTGIAMSANLGNEAVTADSNVTLTGIGATSTLGIVDPSPDATVTGIGFGITLATGSVFQADANVTATGIASTAALGTAVALPVTFAATTGIPITATLSEESVVGDANITLTALPLTMALNTANTLIWSEINTGSAPTDPPGWQEVTTRAA
jgi:hypothetical protein